MAKPYNWITHEDAYTKENLEALRQAEADAEAQEEALVELVREAKNLDLYADSIDFKCKKCGRALPCRHHPLR